MANNRHSRHDHHNRLSSDLSLPVDTGMFKAQCREALKATTERLRQLQQDLNAARIQLDCILDFAGGQAGQEASVTDEQDRELMATWASQVGLHCGEPHVEPKLSDWRALFWHADNIRLVAEKQGKELPPWFVDKYRVHLKLTTD